MAKAAQLETLRELLRDTRSWVLIGKIQKLQVSSTGSVWRAQVEIFPEKREIISRFAWSGVGPESGIYGAPTIGDMVVVVVPDGDEDSSIIVGRLSSDEDKIPAQARQRHTMIRSLADKKLYLASMQKILIGLGTDSPDPAENLVLGQVFKTMMSTTLQICMDLCEALASHVHIGNLGFATDVPYQEVTDDVFSDLKEEFAAVKASPIDDSVILSDISFTEKGS